MIDMSQAHEVVAHDERAGTLTSGAVSATAFAIPGFIKRNTLLLAATQACVGIGNQMVPTLGAIMVMFFLGSPALAGVATSIQGASRFLVAYPIGLLMDTYGRRVGLTVGLVLGIVGAAAIGGSVIAASFPFFLVGLI